MAFCYSEPNECWFEDVHNECYLQIRGRDDIIHVKLGDGWDHFCVFDGDNNESFVFNDHEYGTLFRCWNEMPDECEQQYAWLDLKIHEQISILKHYQHMIFSLCDKSSISELSEGDYFQRAYEKVILYLEHK